jgi:hypothetical protein
MKKILFLKFELIFCFWILKKNWQYHQREMDKFEKRKRFWIWKMWPYYHQREMKNIKICHKNFKWKKWNFHFWNLKLKNWKISFLKFEVKISVWNLINKIDHITREKWKQIEIEKSIFRLCHRDKTSNDTLIPPMYHPIPQV